MSTPAADVNALVQARVQNQFQQDYVRDLVSLKDYAASLIPPYDGKPTWGQLKVALMLAGIPFAHQLEVDTRGIQVSDPALTALGDVVPQADHIPYYTSDTAATLTPLTALGRALLAVSDSAALAALIDLPPEMAFPSVAAMQQAAARKGTVGAVRDQYYLRGHDRWHLVGDWRPTVSFNRQFPTVAKTGDFVTSLLDPDDRPIGYAPGNSDAWVRIDEDWVPIAGRLTVRILESFDQAPEEAWNIARPTLNPLDVALVTGDDYAWLWTGEDDYHVADDTNFQRLGVRPLRNRSAANEAQVLQQASKALVGDTWTVPVSGRVGDDTEQWVATGDLNVPAVRMGDGIRRFSGRTLAELELRDARLGDLGIKTDAPRTAYWHDGNQWQPWHHNALRFRVLDAAAQLPTIHNDFNNQHIAVGNHDIVLYRFGGVTHLYTGPTGDDVKTSRLEHFIPLGGGSALPTSVVTKHAVLTMTATIVDGVFDITAAGPSYTHAGDTDGSLGADAAVFAADERIDILNEVGGSVKPNIVWVSPTRFRYPGHLDVGDTVQVRML